MSSGHENVTGEEDLWDSDPREVIQIIHHQNVYQELSTFGKYDDNLYAVEVNVHCEIVSFIVQEEVVKS